MSLIYKLLEVIGAVAIGAVGFVVVLVVGYVWLHGPADRSHGGCE